MFKAFIFKWKLSTSIIAKVREKGIIWCIRIGGIKFFRDIFPQLLAPLLFIPSYLLRLLGVRFLPIVYVNAIGHLTLEPDCYIKEEKLGIHPSYTTIILTPKHKVANRHLLEYWRPYFKIITSPILCALLYPLSQQKMVKYDISRYVMKDGTILLHEINKKWTGRPPILSLQEHDRQRGQEYLRKLRIPRGAWYVCIHARESGYRPDRDYTNRNIDIDTYLLAIEAIVERGGWCIRMGDPTMKPLPPMKNVIDYAHHSYRSDWMDIFLCANARFFLGSASGLFCLPFVFGVPYAVTNMYPMSERGIRNTDITIPMLLWANKEERFLSFKEVLEHYTNSYHHPDSYYINAGIEVIDSSPEDIASLALEMLDLSEGTMTYTAEDEHLQKQYGALFKPGHCSYGSSSRVGRDFLRKYKHLL